MSDVLVQLLEGDEVPDVIAGKVDRDQLSEG